MEILMKKIWFAAAFGLALLGVAAPASAADLAAKPYVKAPPPPVVAIYDWTGFYIGGNGGWGQARACWDLLTPTGFDDVLGCRDMSGGVVGGQLGYRWQTGSWVWGVEGQGDWADLSSTRVSTLFPAFSTRAKVDGIGLITGQVGYAWNAALLYFKGGAAVTSNNFSILDTVTGANLASFSSTRWGGTVGVGFEYGFGPNWSVGVEYDHLFMGHNNFSVVNPIVAGAVNRISEDVDMVTVRFNYRFNWGGPPVAARY
jgi:outer membrane immunogenic protein